MTSYPTTDELIGALRLAHDHHAFGPDDCTPANCSAKAVLVRLDSSRSYVPYRRIFEDIEQHSQQQWLDRHPEVTSS